MTASLENQIQENGYGIFKAFVDASRVEELSQLCDDLMQPHETRGIDGSKITVYSAKNLVAQTRELDEPYISIRRDWPRQIGCQTYAGPTKWQSRV